MDKAISPNWEFEDTKEVNSKVINGICQKKFEEGVKKLNDSIKAEMSNNALRETRSAQFAMNFVTTVSAK